MSKFSIQRSKTETQLYFYTLQPVVFFFKFIYSFSVGEAIRVFQKVQYSQKALSSQICTMIQPHYELNRFLWASQETQVIFNIFISWRLPIFLSSPSFKNKFKNPVTFSTSTVGNACQSQGDRVQHLCSNCSINGVSSGKARFSAWEEIGKRHTTFFLLMICGSIYCFLGHVT